MIQKAASFQGGSRSLPSDRNRTPTVSVITVCYNAASTIQRTIDSVAGQTDSDYEFIVIDGGSTDGTVEILKENDAVIDRWVSGPDGGIYDAMNRGAKRARGRYLAFLNADDRYLPHTVQRVKEVIDRGEECDVIYGNMIKVRSLGDEVFEREERPDLGRMPKGMGIFHPAAFVKRTVFEAVGGYDTRYKLAADYALFLQLWKEGRSFRHVDAALAFFSLEGVSNAGCGTYREAVEIQKKYRTGTAGNTQRLLWKCRLKKFLRNTVFAAAGLTGTTGVLNRAVRRRWK